MQVIGRVHSCFKQKFATPRQPGLAASATAEIELVNSFNDASTIRELQSFSHIWVIFVFHKSADTWSYTVRPPRLGGNQRVGVFASRSNFRPNPIGMSAVSYHGYRKHNGSIYLKLSGVDLIDQTPVLDIKPYLPYSDCIPTALAGYANDPPQKVLAVRFLPSVESVLARVKEKHVDLKPLIIEVLQLDPRPAYKKDQDDYKCYAITLYDYNIRWRVDDASCVVESIEMLTSV